MSGRNTQSLAPNPPAARTAAHVAGKCLAAAAFGRTSVSSHSGKTPRPAAARRLAGSRTMRSDVSSFDVFISRLPLEKSSSRELASRPEVGNDAPSRKKARRGSEAPACWRVNAASSACASGTRFSNATRQSCVFFNPSFSDDASGISSKGGRFRFAWNRRRSAASGWNAGRRHAARQNGSDATETHDASTRPTNPSLSASATCAYSAKAHQGTRNASHWSASPSCVVGVCRFATESAREGCAREGE